MLPVHKFSYFRHTTFDLRLLLELRKPYRYECHNSNVRLYNLTAYLLHSSRNFNRVVNFFAKLDVQCNVNNRRRCRSYIKRAVIKPYRKKKGPFYACFCFPKYTMNNLGPAEKHIEQPHPFFLPLSMIINAISSPLFAAPCIQIARPDRIGRLSCDESPSFLSIISIFYNKEQLLTSLLLYTIHTIITFVLTERFGRGKKKKARLPHFLLPYMHNTNTILSFVV